MLLGDDHRGQDNPVLILLDLNLPKVDKITGLPLWVIEVIKGDPVARQRTVR